MRVLIAGYPRTGKTMMGQQRAQALGIVLHSTDDLIPLGWSEASEHASHWFDLPGPWVIEGVAVPRALRKWRERHPDAAPPYDELIYLTEPWEGLSRGQEAMAKGIETVMAELGPWLR